MAAVRKLCSVIVKLSAGGVHYDFKTGNSLQRTLALKPELIVALTQGVDMAEVALSRSSANQIQLLSFANLAEIENLPLVLASNRGSSSKSQPIASKKQETNVEYPAIAGLRTTAGAPQPAVPPMRPVNYCQNFHPPQAASQAPPLVHAPVELLSQWNYSTYQSSRLELPNWQMDPGYAQRQLSQPHMAHESQLAQPVWNFAPAWPPPLPPVCHNPATAMSVPFVSTWSQQSAPPHRVAHPPHFSHYPQHNAPCRSHFGGAPYSQDFIRLQNIAAMESRSQTISTNRAFPAVEAPVRGELDVAPRKVYTNRHYAGPQKSGTERSANLSADNSLR